MSARVRLLIAACLCFVALGLGWATTPAIPGYVTAGFDTTSCSATYDGSMDCTYGYAPGYLIAGRPEGAARGFETDARIVLVPAVALLLWASRRRTEGSVLVVRVIAGALAVISVRAAGEGQVVGAAVGAIACLLLLSVLRGPGRQPGSRVAGPVPKGTTAADARWAF